MRTLLIIGLILAVTGGLIATGIVPFKLSMTSGVALRNTNLWVQGRIVHYGEPVGIDYVFQVVDDGMFKFFGKFYRKYAVTRDNYAYKIKFDSSKNGKLRILLLRIVVSYKWDPDNVKEFNCNHWCGQKWKTDTDGWAQDIVVRVYASIYRAKLDETNKILYLIEKEKDVSYDEFARSTILVGAVIRDPRIINTIMLNFGHSSDTYEITLFKKTLLNNGTVVWNQDAPRVYRVVLDCSWKGFYHEVWPARIEWNGALLYDNSNTQPSTTTVWSPIETSPPSGGVIRNNETVTVTTVNITETPEITYTTPEKKIINMTTTTMTTTTIKTVTSKITVGEVEGGDMLYGIIMSLAGIALMVLGLRR